MSLDISTIFNIVNTIGVLVFAFVGALKGVQRRMDILGIFITGIATALGGGMVRDVMVHRLPYALVHFYDMFTAITGVIIACLAVLITRRDYSNTTFVLLLDALGLAAFASTGAMIAIEGQMGIWGVIMLSTMTGVGGGIIADILCARIPGVMKTDFYAVCCIAGGAVFYGCIEYGFGVDVATSTCTMVVFILRILAIFLGWKLPRLFFPIN